jgi:hypothetical protein
MRSQAETEFEQLQVYLRQWHGRRRQSDALLWLPRGLLAGLLVAAALAALARTRPLLTHDELLSWISLLAATGLFLSLLLLWFGKRQELARQARFADRHFGLQERISTALEIQSGGLEVPAELAQRQLADALRAAARVDPATALPLRFNRQDLLLLLMTTALLSAAVLLPNPQEEILLHQRALDQLAAEQVQALTAIAEEVRDNPTLTAEQQEAVVQPLERAIEELQAGGLSQEQLVAVLSEAEADLRELSSRQSQGALRQQLQAAGQPLARNPAASDLGRQLQDGNLSQAGTAAATLADSLSSLTAAEAAALAQDLAATAEALQNVDAQLAAELDRAAQALRDGDVAAAQQALREAAATLHERGGQQAAADQAAEVAAQVAQGRQEVTQAGQQAGESQQASGQQAGESQQASGQQAGEGQQAGGQQAGEGPLQPGLGTGDAGQGQTAGPGPGGGPGPNVFAPNFADLDGLEGIAVELPAECRIHPTECGLLIDERPTAFDDVRSVVPYHQVFGEYRDAAYEALSGDYIPLGLKGVVRDYFSSLEP